MGQQRPADGSEHDVTGPTEVGHDVAEGCLSERPFMGAGKAAAAVLLRIGDPGPASVEQLSLEYAAGRDLLGRPTVGTAETRRARPGFHVGF